MSELTDAAAPGSRNGHTPFPIVGLGASAGGFEAFRQLLSALPDATGMAFLFVQHLDAHHESQLSELLSKSTRMPVTEAVQGRPIEPDHVYVIAPNTNLTLAKGVLQVTPRGESRAPHLAVDHLFRSIAEDQQARAVGVVLSGTGSDGTLGLCEIKAVGGITFAQEQHTARHPGMPKSAIESGCVDFVASVEEIAERLVALGRHPYHAPQGEAPEAGATQADDDQLERILRVVQGGTGVDFREYRDTTIRRRILRRMALHGLHSHAEYLRLLGSDRNEITALYQDLLINVTSFFRDPALFEALKQRVFPEIARGKSPGQPIRMWVAGCSTGQEAYSLAIALWEFLDTQPVRPPVQIFATDLSDPASLDRARTGVYPESIESEISPERLRRFFTHEDHTYRICKEIRDACIFARQNLTSDPPFSHVQVISCRNVLIYMSPALQRRVLPIFHYALDAPGFLALGTAESVGPFADLFEVVDRDHKVYAKRPTAGRQTLYFAESKHARLPMVEPLATRTTGREGAFQREADRLLLSRYAPAGVLVDENFDVVQFRGQTSPYLDLPPGEPTTNVLRMAREGLLQPLREALLEAQRSGEPVRHDRVRLRGDEELREIDLQVLPVQPSDAAAGCLLVLFEHSAPSPRAQPRTPQRGLLAWLRGDTSRGSEASPERRAPEGDSTERLRRELSATKEYLQSLIERQDAANEELRSANEEVQSSNEELQSTNEELETAKEELQSTNEELNTVNEQLNSRNAELSLVNNDLVNLQNSTTIPIVVLGSDLRIRRFTAPAKRLLNLLPSDVGRPISDLAAPIAIPELDQLVVQVVDTVQPVEREIRGPGGRWHALRIFPYRTSDNRIEGAVLALIDIEESKRAEAAAREARDYADAIVETVREPLVILDAELRVRRANRSFYETFDVTPAETETKTLFELGERQWEIPQLRTLLEEVLPQHQAIHDFEVTHAFPRIGARTMLLNARQILTEGQPERILLSIEDVSSQRRADEALRTSDRRKDEFLAILAHELRNPLGSMLTSLEWMKRVEHLPEPVQRAKGLLDRPLRLVLRLVDDLLDVSRITEGKIILRLQRASLSELVEAAVDNARAQIDERRHELSVELESEDLWLDADPVRLTQVISNVLSNAARYTPDGGRIQLTAARDAANEQIVISIRDTGVGIAPEQIGAIFAPFYQAPQSRSTPGGLGVGLALAKNLVELHGGSIEARSTGGGQGSEFVIRLPAAAGRADPRSASPSSQPRVAAPPQRILLVEDNADQADSMALLLESLGHQVRVESDGRNVVEVALDFAPDVALVDIGLPGIDGYEVARRLRERPELRRMRLIAQTGWGRDDDRRRTAEVGFDHHLVKPVEIDDLQKLLALPRSDG